MELSESFSVLALKRVGETCVKYRSDISITLSITDLLCDPAVFDLRPESPIHGADGRITGGLESFANVNKLDDFSCHCEVKPSQSRTQSEFLLSFATKFAERRIHWEIRSRSGFLAQ